MALICGQPLILSRSASNDVNAVAAVSSSSLGSRRRQWSLPSDQTSLRRLAIASSTESSRSAACRLSIPRRLNRTTCSAVRGDESSSSSTQIESDVQTRVSLIDQVSLRLQPFLQLTRIDKPFWFVNMFLWPFYWGAALAAQNGSGPDLRLFALLGVASSIFHMATCTVNDLFDKDFDGKVERTKRRPLVTGAVTPLQAWTLSGVLVLLYPMFLSHLEAFRFGSQGQVLVAIQLFLGCTYPLMKRWTHWTPAYLALMINWGAIMGWTAVQGTGDLISSPVLLPLYFAACCWTLMYETIYAHMDIKDDVKAGVKSLALLLGRDSKLWLAVFTVMAVASLSIAGHNAALGWPFYAGVAAAGAHMASQVVSVDFENPADCRARFISNKWVGAFVFGGIVCGKLLA